MILLTEFEDILCICDLEIPVSPAMVRVDFPDSNIALLTAMSSSSFVVTGFMLQIGTLRRVKKSSRFPFTCGLAVCSEMLRFLAV